MTPAAHSIATSLRLLLDSASKLAEKAGFKLEYQFVWGDVRKTKGMRT